MVSAKFITISTSMSAVGSGMIITSTMIIRSAMSAKS